MNYFINFIVGILAPMVVPIFSHGLSKIIISTSIQGTNQFNCKEYKILSDFYKEMPSAFIGNAIWGFTYNIQAHTKTTIFWMVVYFVVTIIAVGFLIFRYINYEKIVIFKKCINYFSLFLFVLFIFRLFCL